MPNNRLQTLIERAKRLMWKPETEKDEKNEAEWIKKICLFIGDIIPIHTLEAVLEIYKKRLSDLQNNELLHYMHEQGSTEIKTESGERLEVEKYLSVKVKDRAKLNEWLIQIGREDVLKTILDFGHLKPVINCKLIQALEKADLQYSKEEDSVHWKTLTKIVSDRLKAGEGLPPADAVEVSAFDRVKIS